jgi:hypothetical protein
VGQYLGVRAIQSISDRHVDNERGERHQSGGALYGALEAGGASLRVVNCEDTRAVSFTVADERHDAVPVALDPFSTGVAQHHREAKAMSFFDLDSHITLPTQ